MLLLLFIAGMATYLFVVVATGYAAEAKGRNPWLWVTLAFVFGILALIAIAALPALPRASERRH